MDPITVIEILASVTFVTILFVIASILPKKLRKHSLFAASFLTMLLILFFFIRPFWINYQITIKTEQLNQYLDEKYPNQEWQISRQIGRHNNPYNLNVTFKNEKDWIYTYAVKSEKNICQAIWTPPDGKRPSEGIHFEMDHCE